MTDSTTEQTHIRVGISTCLLGERVRFDAGHKKDIFITELLGKYFEFVAVCPEVDVGMGVPREAVRLVGTSEAPRMVGTRSGQDWTDRMNRYAGRRTRELGTPALCGYILKKDSPSCGMERVRIYSDSGMPERTGVGLFARAVLARFPLLPIEEEGRLHDARLRENFIERVFAFHRLQLLFSGRFSRSAVIAFHARHKYLILAHSPAHYQELGKLVAAVAQYSPGEFRDCYSMKFMEALRASATPKKHANVLRHILGFLKNHLVAEDKQYILGVIADYEKELVPLIVPITLIKHYITKFNVRYIVDQHYLSPHPKELMLRNHV